MPPQKKVIKKVIRKVIRKKQSERSNMMKIESFSPEITEQAGYEIGQKVEPGTIICLNGDLGVGKTVFTQGFAKGLGIEV